VLAAGLFIRTLSNIHSIDLGFKRENILLFRVDARRAGYKDAALARFYAGLTERIRGVPGVVAAGLSDLPLASGYWNDTGLEIPGAPALASGKKREFSPVSVDEAFLGTLQIPVVLGRSLESRDMASPRVAVITERLAKVYFPGENPVGRRIGVDGGMPDIEIVGVARTSRYNSVKEDETPPVAYLPYTQDPKGLNQVFFEVRTAGDPLALANTMRQIVHDANPTVPVSNLTTQAAQIDQTIGQERMFASLCGCFAALALAIACVGLYGTMAYMVARRTSEIGIRVAMGAPRGGIVWMVLREAIGVAAVGLAIGLAVAWQTAHVVASFLYGVKPNDPLATIGSALVLLAAAILAGYAPAWRASRIDPMVALRHE
jgi:predicted permease